MKQLGLGLPPEAGIRARPSMGSVTTAERKQWTWVDENFVLISTQAGVETRLRDLVDRIEDDGLPPLTITLPKR